MKKAYLIQENTILDYGLVQEGTQAVISFDNMAIQKGDQEDPSHVVIPTLEYVTNYIDGNIIASAGGKLLVLRTSNINQMEDVTNFTAKPWQAFIVSELNRLGLTPEVGNIIDIVYTGTNPLYANLAEQYVLGVSGWEKMTSNIRIAYTANVFNGRIDVLETAKTNLENKDSQLIAEDNRLEQRIDAIDNAYKAADTQIKNAATSLTARVTTNETDIAALKPRMTTVEQRAADYIANKPSFVRFIDLGAISVTAPVQNPILGVLNGNVLSWDFTGIDMSHFVVGQGTDFQVKSTDGTKTVILRDTYNDGTNSPAADLIAGRVLNVTSTATNLSVDLTPLTANEKNAIVAAGYKLTGIAQLKGSSAGASADQVARTAAQTAQNTADQAVTNLGTLQTQVDTLDLTDMDPIPGQVNKLVATNASGAVEFLPKTTYATPASVTSVADTAHSELTDAIAQEVEDRNAAIATATTGMLTETLGDARYVKLSDVQSLINNAITAALSKTLEFRADDGTDITVKVG